MGNELKLSLKIDDIKSTDTYGVFSIQPLDRGMGTTLGNTLRRVLLTSIPGAAITNVKIDGILHEFSTVKGVKDDVSEIISIFTLFIVSHHLKIINLRA